MAKFIKINNNLSINIDSIYSISKEVDDKKILNIEDIAIWNEKFSDYIEEISNKGIPPVIEIKPNVMYQLGISPESEEYNILYYNYQGIFVF